MQRRLCAAAAVLIAIGAISPAAAPPAQPVLRLDGNVKTPMRYDANAVRQMPPMHVDVVYGSTRGTVKASFAGALLWSLIAGAGGIADAGHGVEVRHAIRITAGDGYVVVLSAGEIAPDVGGKQALIAYERDGKPLDSLWLVMPGDRSDARYVHDVTSITVE